MKIKANTVEGITITAHAYEKAMERLKWKPVSLDRMVERIYRKGTPNRETIGHLKRHVNKLGKIYKSEVRIYGEVMYFFRGKTLITLYRVPNNLKKYLQ